jgi:hypothetical protein
LGGGDGARREEDGSGSLSQRGAGILGEVRAYAGEAGESDGEVGEYDGEVGV